MQPEVVIPSEFDNFLMNSIKQKLLEKTENVESKGFSWLLIILFLILLSAAVMYFGGNDTYSDSTAVIEKENTNGRAPRTYSIFYTGGVFSPTNLRIHSGDLVEFQNRAFLPIKIVADNQGKAVKFGFENSGDISSSGKFSFTFSSAGIFNYYNERNPNEAGAIIVK